MIYNVATTNAFAPPDGDILDVLDIFLGNTGSLMSKRKIRQKDLAKQFNVQPTTVNNWFKKKSVINLEQAQAIARYLDVEFYALCFDYENLPLLDMNQLGSQEMLKNPIYKLARELGYPIFTQEVE